jgi:hypothetical protein
MLHFPWLIGTRSDPTLNVFMRLDSEAAMEEARAAEAEVVSGTRRRRIPDDDSGRAQARKIPRNGRGLQ